MFHTLRVFGSRVREAFKVLVRSPRWREVRDTHLKSRPFCAACGRAEHLQVHHIVPFHENPLLELDARNLITLCMSKYECHLKLGHGGGFHYFNPKVVDHALEVNRRPITRMDVEKKAVAAREVIALQRRR